MLCSEKAPWGGILGFPASCVWLGPRARFWEASVSLSVGKWVWAAVVLEAVSHSHL